MLGDVFRHQLGVDLGFAHLLHVDDEFPADHFFQPAAQILDFLTLLADNHARPGGMDFDGQLAGRPLDIQSGDPGPLEFLVALDEIANPAVFQHQGCEILPGEPNGIPFTIASQTETDGVNFLAQSMPP